jgi:hypothetical protein
MLSDLVLALSDLGWMAAAWAVGAGVVLLFAGGVWLVLRVVSAVVSWRRSRRPSTPVDGAMVVGFSFTSDTAPSHDQGTGVVS